eukprot:NODE_1225_length_1204_cov_285.606614.p1 GENE.NODE_1225_length_1204_cov_285.606614~~NODE_1225_length_1204_cov_285.606614.p1  ORF type:complete len:354 (-),score=69.51 NODE_1225_length_1204_cov_285.606614:111-1172(-)
MLLPIVLLTGASGFIGSHVAKQLLESGFRVRGTVRSDPASPKLSFLRDLDAQGHLELVQADLVATSQDGWHAIAKGVSYCVHVASPVPARLPKNETEELMLPALAGTEVVVRACGGAGARRIVLTSSGQAIFGDRMKPAAYTEEDWTDPSSADVPAYARSKTLAEQAAWRLIREFSDTTDLTVLNPNMVIGPLLSNDVPGSMQAVLAPFSLWRMPAALNVHFAFVDVRDVAAAHVSALTAPAAKNQRIIVGGPTHSMTEACAILRAEFGPMGYWITPFTAPYALAYVLSFFSPAVAFVLPFWGKRFDVDVSKCTSVLNVTSRPARESLIEGARSLIKHGLVPPPPHGVASDEF